MTKTTGKSWLKRLSPLAAIVIILLLFLMSGAHKYFTFEQLQIHRFELINFVQKWPVIAPLIYLALYALMTVLSVPAGLVLTITGGFLFGSYLGTLYTVVGATIGASIIFSVVKMGFGEALKKNAGNFLDKMRAGFSQNAFSYLLVLRLLPLFPFWLVNIVPALLDVRLKVFFTATFMGIIPGTFVYSSIGEGLGSIFDRGETPNLGIIFEPKILTPIIGLAILALLPVFKKPIMKFFEKK